MNIRELLTSSIWVIGLHNKDQFQGYMAFREDGRIAAYLNRSQYYWELHDDRLCIQDIDRKTTITFWNRDRHEEYWEGELTGPPRYKIFLSINKSLPMAVKYSGEIAEIVRKGGFYLAHFRRVDGVYNEGEALIVHPHAFIEPSAILPRGALFELGAFSYFSGHSKDNLSVGRYSSIAVGVRVLGDAHPVSFLTTSSVAVLGMHHDLFKHVGIHTAPPVSAFEHRSNHTTTFIGNDVWIGADCLLKPGITIGDGAVVAARSIVTKDVPPYTIVGGAPAKTIRARFDDAVVRKLLELKWWDYDLGQIPLQWHDVHGALEILERCIAAGARKLAFERTDYGLAIMKTVRL